MKILLKVTLVFVLGIIFFAGNLKAENLDFPKPYAQYKISTENIASWYEVDYGFYIHLTPQGQKEFSSITSENLNKPIELYVGDMLVSTPIVREVISSGNMALSADSDMKTKLRTILPQSREDNDDD